MSLLWDHLQKGVEQVARAPPPIAAAPKPSQTISDVMQRQIYQFVKCILYQMTQILDGHILQTYRCMHNAMHNDQTQDRKQAAGANQGGSDEQGGTSSNHTDASHWKGSSIQKYIDEIDEAHWLYLLGIRSCRWRKGEFSSMGDIPLCLDSPKAQSHRTLSISPKHFPRPNSILLPYRHLLLGTNSSRLLCRQCTSLCCWTQGTSKQEQWSRRFPRWCNCCMWRPRSGRGRCKGTEG